LAKERVDDLDKSASFVGDAILRRSTSSLGAMVSEQCRRGWKNTPREFYQGVLGIPEIPKPPHLAKRGGAWFERGELKIHLGVEADFRPAQKAHPALLVVDLEGLIAHLKDHNIKVIVDPLEGYLRVYIADPFGNRIELMERRIAS
jgi:catechol 2,3-dioxygenase-like lactoylglutathione lyase family enzyme